MKPNTLFVFIFGLFLFSCHPKIKDDGMNKEDDGDLKGGITLIFHKVPEQTFIPLSESKALGGRQYFEHIASYGDADGLRHFINPRRSPNIDTINVSIKDSKIEIYFQRFGLEGVSYLFNNGDVVRVEYENGNPKLEVLNRQVRPFDFSFDIASFKDRGKNDLSPFEKFFRLVPIFKPTKPLSKEDFRLFHERELRKNSVRLLEALVDKKNMLDSLYESNLISKDAYDYNILKLEYYNWSRLAKLKEYKMPVGRIGMDINEEYGESKLISLAPARGDTSKSEPDFSSRNGLLGYKFYREFLLDNFMPNYFENQTTRHSFTYDNFGGSRYSWDVVFDTVQRSNLFSEASREFLLFNYMNRISRDMSPEAMRIYYDKFKKSVNNKTYLDIIGGKYGLDSMKTDKLVLKDGIGHKYFLEDILEESTGKVVFIEFWASWCKPCIETIPDGNKLRKDYLGKGVVFISIAVDKDLSLWKSSKTREMRSNLKHDYILENPYSSSFVKNNHIEFVPRYILIDGTGDIVHQSAPGPENNEIRKLFDDFLSHR